MQQNKKHTQNICIRKQRKTVDGGGNTYIRKKHTRMRTKFTCIQKKEKKEKNACRKKKTHTYREKKKLTCKRK